MKHLLNMEYFKKINKKLGYKTPQKMSIGDKVVIGDNVRINISEYLELGDRTIINDNVLIEGRYIQLGKETWIDEYSHIGGGSCFDRQSSLKCGDFLHMGKYSHINTAREVKIGNECGIGINTKIFTHGSYLSAYDGFPVQFSNITIGDRVWLPNAWVNPGVTIGNDVVIAAMSLVNKNIPSNCLAGGIPVKIIKENCYPKVLTQIEKEALIKQISYDLNMELLLENNILTIQSDVHSSFFDLENKTISGIGDEKTELLKNQLRRYGIRFKYSLREGVYQKW